MLFLFCYFVVLCAHKFFACEGRVPCCCFIGPWLLEFLKLKGLTCFQGIRPFLNDTLQNHILLKFKAGGVVVVLVANESLEIRLTTTSKSQVR